MKEAWALLLRLQGTYSGKGVNHEQQPFTSRFSLREELPGKLMALESSASGASGEVFHHEKSWIGPDITGALTLFVASNNHPGITAHVFDRMEERDGTHLVFRFGNLANQNEFREEVTFSLFADGSIAHHYAWGMPGGKFAPRSGSRLQRAIL